MSNGIPINDILALHERGKLTAELHRPLMTQDELSIIYSPGVADVCQMIHEDERHMYDYTMKGNCVAVVTDGTAVLGLGDIGPAASLPVMEGKACLFKRFAKVDAWPQILKGVRVNGDSGRTDVEKFITATVALADQYGGINLEDIAGPECFEIEDRLDEMLDIPVFHDDQWGTAIITLAGVLNYCLLSGKAPDKLKIVINGAGAAGIRIADMLKADGCTDVVLADSRGVIHDERTDLTEIKTKHVAETPHRDLADAMKGADVFIGVSVAGCVTPDMVESMNDYPGIFAMANPTPEIMPEEVAEALHGKEFVMATGRSDYPNQVNNVLGFPYIFRGALDVRATSITMNMKVAASEALADLTHATDTPQDIEEELEKAYGRKFSFGPDYILPVPFDPRLLEVVGSAVAKAAVSDGVNKLAL